MKLLQSDRNKDPYSIDTLAKLPARKAILAAYRLEVPGDVVT